MKNTTSAAVTTTVKLTRSEYGTPRPTIRINAPEGMHWRQVRVFAFTLAAKIETATPARESWSVQVVDGGIYLELCEGTTAEAERAMDLLKQVTKG